MHIEVFPLSTAFQTITKSTSKIVYSLRDEVLQSTCEDNVRRDEGAAADLSPETLVQRREDGSHPGEISSGAVVAGDDQGGRFQYIEFPWRLATFCNIYRQ